MDKINIEEIDSNINKLKNTILELRKKRRRGDSFYINYMDNLFSENLSDLRRKSVFLNDFEYLKEFANKMAFGGYAIEDRDSVIVMNKIYELKYDDLLKKDIYYALLFLRQVLEGLNNEFNYRFSSYSDNYHYAYVVGNTYKLAKSILFRIKRIYGGIYSDCYDYGLTSCVDNLYNLAIKYKSDLRTQDQKIRDNIKDAGNGCMELIGEVILCFLIFGGIGFLVSQCSN